MVYNVVTMSHFTGTVILKLWITVKMTTMHFIIVTCQNNVTIDCTICEVLKSM